jgi:hypothetical protein
MAKKQQDTRLDPVESMRVNGETFFDADGNHVQSQDVIAPPEPVPELIVPIEVSLAVQMMPAGTRIDGFMGLMRSASVEFPPHLCDRFRRLVAGLHNSHATYPGPGGKVVHVDSAADALRWLVSQLPE